MKCEHEVWHVSQETGNEKDIVILQDIAVAHGVFF